MNVQRTCAVMCRTLKIDFFIGILRTARKQQSVRFSIGHAIRRSNMMLLMTFILHESKCRYLQNSNRDSTDGTDRIVEEELRDGLRPMIVTRYWWLGLARKVLTVSISS